MEVVFWKDGNVSIIKYFDGCYALIYKGVEVMEHTNFDVISRYVHAEFML